MKALFPPPPLPPPHAWGPPEHADGRRGLKVGGTIVFSLGAGMAIFSAVVFKLGFPGMQDEAAWLSGWGGARGGRGEVGANLVSAPFAKACRATPAATTGPTGTEA